MFRKVAFGIFLTMIAVTMVCHAQPMQVVFKSNQKDTATALKAEKVYVLKKQAVNADFNYVEIKNISTKNLLPVFEPVNGLFNYYQFIATFKGEGYNGTEAPVIKDFHDILIIKTDKNNVIVDAYQYTLEWAEMLLQYDLFKSTISGMALTNNLKIDQLKFERSHGGNSNDKALKENGTILLK